MTSRLRRDDGFTTAEIIVAMAVSAVLGAMTLFVILGLSKASDASIKRSEMATTARVALDSWGALLAVRESPEQDESDVASIEQIAGDSITFFASIDNRVGDGTFLPPTRVEIGPGAGGSIVERRYAPEHPNQVVTERILVPAGSLSLRAYTSSSRAVALSGELSNAQRASIARIEISVTVRDDNGKAYVFGGESDVPAVTPAPAP